MGLQQESRVLTLPQGTPDKDVSIVIKANLVEFRRKDNDSLLFVMTSYEVSELALEVNPTPPANNVQ